MSEFLIHVIELPKLPKELKEDSNDILLWAKFINTEQKEEFDMIAQKTPILKVPIKNCKISA